MSIVRRTAFIEVDTRFPDLGNYHRPHDWALVTTTIGTMAEPFNMFQKNVVGVQPRDLDYTDEIARIDEIQQFNLDKGMQIIGDRVHGGYLMSRTGR